MMAFTLQLPRDTRRISARFTHQAILTKAFEAFSAEYPQWADSLFDLYFLRKLPAELLTNADAVGVAQAWTQQFPNQNFSLERQHVQRMLPIAKAFVRLYLQACSQPLHDRLPVKFSASLLGTTE